MPTYVPSRRRARRPAHRVPILPFGAGIAACGSMARAATVDAAVHPVTAGAIATACLVIVGLAIALVRARRAARRAVAGAAQSMAVAQVLRQNAIIHATVEAVITVDEQQRIVLFNPAAQRMFGCSEQEAIGSDLSRFIPERFRAAHREHVREFGRSRMAERLMSGDREILGLRSSGDEFPVEGSISHVEVAGEDGAQHAFFTVLLRDISERQETQRRLDRLQKRYQVILDQSPTAICVAESGRIAMANVACLELFGAKNAAAMLGRDLLEFFPADARPDLLARIARAYAGDPRTWFEQHIVRHDGDWRDVEISAARVPDHGHEAVQLVIRDVTERNRIDQMLTNSREELRRLSGNLIQVREEERRRIARELHDELGQRLAAIRMLISPLATTPTGCEELHARIEEAEQMVDELVKAVRRIASDLRPAMLDDLGLAAAIEWLAADCAKLTGLQVSMSCQTPDEGIPDAARTAAYRMVQEALTNVTRHAGASRVDIEVRRTDDTLTVRVTDNGIGLMPSATRKAGSYGLMGMRERAHLLGGSLAISSEPGCGSSIEMRIPLQSMATTTDDSTRGET